MNKQCTIDYYRFVLDFQVERRQLLETVGPELQTLFDEHEIEVRYNDIVFEFR